MMNTPRFEVFGNRLAHMAPQNASGKRSVWGRLAHLAPLASKACRVNGGHGAGQSLIELTLERVSFSSVQWLYGWPRCPHNGKT